MEDAGAGEVMRACEAAVFFLEAARPGFQGGPATPRVPLHLHDQRPERRGGGRRGDAVGGHRGNPRRPRPHRHWESNAIRSEHAHCSWSRPLGRRGPSRHHGIEVEGRVPDAEGPVRSAEVDQPRRTAEHRRHMLGHARSTAGMGRQCLDRTVAQAHRRRRRCDRMRARCTVVHAVAVITATAWEVGIAVFHGSARSFARHGTLPVCAVPRPLCPSSALRHGWPVPGLQAAGKRNRSGSGLCRKRPSPISAHF